MACDTEWIRGERTWAGILAFCHLTNNYGYTGDWYINDIKDLEPGVSLKWLKHAFAPVAVFVDLADQRYFPNGNFVPGEKLFFNLVGVNDLNEDAGGIVTAKLIDSGGNTVSAIKRTVELPAYRRVNIPAFLNLPDATGGYLVLAEFLKNGSAEATMSRRYIKVGEYDKQTYWTVEP